MDFLGNKIFALWDQKCWQAFFCSHWVIILYLFFHLWVWFGANWIWYYLCTTKSFCSVLHQFKNSMRCLVTISAVTTFVRSILIKSLQFIWVRGSFTNVFASSPKYSLEICILLKSFFLWEFQAETLYVCPKPCFGHTYKVSAWNSQHKCYFWHCIFSLARRQWNNPLVSELRQSCYLVLLSVTR